MKILSAKQIRIADAFTIKHEPIASIDLMERAALRLADIFYQNHDPKNKLAIVCGTGNNGGDGLALSRLLLEKGYKVQTYIVQDKKGGSEDFNTNLARLKPLLQVNIIGNNKSIPDFNAYHTIIDALFGTGLTRTVSGLFADVICAINQANREIMAIDIPSGLFADWPTESVEQAVIVKANTTITFQLPKLAFFIPENFQYVGRWRIAEIGLNEHFINEQESNFSTIEQADVSKLLPIRKKFDHKGTFGHGQLIGGSYGKMGAITLAAEAFMRTGAGLLTVTIPSSGINIMQSSVPEAMVLEQPGDKHITGFNILTTINSIGIGPGLGQEKATAKAFADFLRNNKKPLVLDADALNIISENREMLALLPAETIITPHIKEFDQLAGSANNHWQRIENAKVFSQKWQLITVLKGAHTIITDQYGKIKFNTTGNPGMATAGAGDVLLGIIASLRTQGLSSIDAAIAGTYIHGRAGDKAAHKKSMPSLIARDIIDSLGEVFLGLVR